ncbi:hemopexin [Betta splendens]|uniref:Hemopexin n=1 Tax=Betta splendens TaxID=158456 RepID=A0A6P7LEH6_BETSP|nr:hemopexin [Betta splendens]
MKLAHILCLCLVLALSWADHHEGHGKTGQADKGHGEKGHVHKGPLPHGHDHTEPHPDRCKGIEMDAATVNEEGIPYFFKNHTLFKGFRGKAEFANETFNELDEHHHLGHVDAAFLMHNPDDPTHHDHIFFFLDTHVFSYYQHKLERGFPKLISQVFPGIPDHLDAAVECPKPECNEHSVIFFKGKDILHYNVKTKAVDKKTFASMPNCTSALRFTDHYYCFHGHQFSKFDPKTGAVHGKYPKETRGSFTRCPKFGERSDPVERERCSRVHLDAITSDDAGNIYAFRSHHFIQKNEGNDTLTVDTVENDFKELHSEVDAAFTYNGHLHMIKGDKFFVYKAGNPPTLVPGFPKALHNELGLNGPIDAAFVCQDHHIAHVIKGTDVYDVELKAAPRTAKNKRPFSLFRKVNAAMCGPEGVTVIVGNHFYRFASTQLFVASRALPEQHKVSLELFGCDH